MSGTHDNDGWIANDGLPPELPDGKRMEIRFRIGLEQKRVSDPRGWRWTDTADDYDIVAYRVVQP